MRRDDEVSRVSDHEPGSAGKLIDGVAQAAAVVAQVADAVRALTHDHGVTPGLAVVVVGDDPASRVYVRNKIKRTTESGMRSLDHYLPAAVSQPDLLDLIARLNRDDAVNAILVQLPLPAHMDATRVLAAIDPGKDADGLHPLNAGRLEAGRATLLPCTPHGCILLAKSVRRSLAGAEAIVIGRSAIVGKPLGQLLLAENATVTIAHSRSVDLPAICRRADLVFAAVGRPELVRQDWIKPGAIVIDVGINRIVGPDGKSRLVGDVAFEEARAVAGAITPVPGGVGPMTIACLLWNTLIATHARIGVAPPSIA